MVNEIIFTQIIDQCEKYPELELLILKSVDEITVEDIKKVLGILIEILFKENRAKEATEFLRLMVSKSETDEELEICEHAVEVVRKEMINRLKSA